MASSHGLAWRLVSGGVAVEALAAVFLAARDIRVFTPLGFVSEGSRVFWLGIRDISLTVLDVRRAGVKPLVTVGVGLC